MTDLLEPTVWTRWYSQRPPDPEDGKPRPLYWWRVGECKILDLVLSPEWTGKLSFCGMGYSPGEWWPPHSHWDGYNRTVPKNTEWALASLDPTPEQLRASTVVWRGLELEPCPWSGKPPAVEYGGRWIGAAPYQCESLSLRTRWGTTRWTSAERMRNAWNSRYAPEVAGV